jgi:hypothetical protein
MTLALQSITLPSLAHCHVPLAELSGTHGVNSRSAQMYSRFSDRKPC